MIVDVDNFCIRTRELNQTILLQPFTKSIDLSTINFLVGRSGIGKSLLGKSLAGFRFPELSYDGKINFHQNLTIYYAPQFATDYFIESSSIATNMNLILSSVHQNKKENFFTLLDRFELSELKEKLSFPVNTCSSGMKYRLMLAFLILKNPDCLIIDEPFASLDKKTSELIFHQLLDFHHKHKIGMVFITHVLPNHITNPFEIIELTE